MTINEIAFFFMLVVVYSIIAGRLDRYSVTMPMFFVLASALIGPYVLGVIQIPIDAEAVKHLAEITLVLLLFADASRLNFRKVREEASLPGRLLLIGLPLTILFGAGVVYFMFPHHGLGFALLIATILAPTDAALGMPIFNNPKVPMRIRTALNVESGLNDGIATPLVTLFIAMTIAEEGASQAGWLSSALAQMGIGILVGVGIGLAGGWLFSAASRNNWASKTMQEIGNFALALVCYYLSLILGGNGFIAAFIGGLVFGYVSKNKLENVTEFTEANGTLFSLFVWAVFGAAVVVPLILNFNPLAFLFAILALTVVRMLPVAIALLGTRLRLDTVLMMGWLGPRGLASVVFMLIAFESLHEAQLETDLLLAMAGWTIILSVLLHALSAVPLANWYARNLETADPDVPELREIAESPITRRSLSHIE
jgi:NhaP-type Na+/H+ or K+/H+ antiporter